MRDRTAYNAYMREYVLRRYHARMAASIQLFGGHCVKCGASSNLQFDHIDPATKAFTIGKMWGLSDDKLQVELKKCQLLCKNCHELKTMGENGRKPAKGTHGTISAYRYCKCDLCRAAKAASTREYRKTHARK